MSDQPLVVRIQLALYQVLLGRIPRILRAVRFENNTDGVTIVFSMDLRPANLDCALLQEAMAEFIRMFPQLNIQHVYEIGKVLPQMLGYIYRRHGEIR